MATADQKPLHKSAFKPPWMGGVKQLVALAFSLYYVCSRDERGAFWCHDFADLYFRYLGKAWVGFSFYQQGKALQNYRFVYRDLLSVYKSTQNNSIIVQSKFMCERTLCKFCGFVAPTCLGTLLGRHLDAIDCWEEIRKQWLGLAKSGGSEKLSLHVTRLYRHTNQAFSFFVQNQSWPYSVRYIGSQFW